MSTTSSSPPLFNAVANALRAIKHRIEDLTFRERIEEHIYGGRQFRIAISDKMAAEWYGGGCARMRELDLLAGRGIRLGGLVFDVGAHQCVVAMMLAAEVGPKGKVVAVEATERNAEISRRNIALNRIGNVEVLHAAAARADGPVLFSQRRNGAIALDADAYAARKVDGVSIDTLSARYGLPDLVYMDIEGYELEALKGARQTLSSRASWFIEVHGDDMLAQFGARNVDVRRVFEANFDLYYSLDNAKEDFKPLTCEADVPHERFFLAAIRKS